MVTIGKRQPPRFAGVGVDLARPGGAHAAAQHVDAQHVVAVGIEHLAGADHRAPPAGLAGNRVRLGDELVAGQRVTDQDDVRPVGVQPAIGLVGQRKGASSAPESSRSGRLRPSTTRWPGNTKWSPGPRWRKPAWVIIDAAERPSCIVSPETAAWVSTFSLLSPNRTIMSEPPSIAGPPFARHRVPEAKMSRERTLDEVRADIDAIDDTIQDLLIRRTELVEEVRSIKRGWRVKISAFARGGNRLSADRAASGAVSQARSGGDLAHPDLCDTVVRGTVLGRRTRAGGRGDGYWDVARDHFGPFTPMSRHGSARAVIETVRRQDAIVGVLPMPRHDDGDPWWRHIVTGNPEAPKIIARLPFAGVARGARAVEALVICPVTVIPTGRDRSFLVVETDGRSVSNSSQTAARRRFRLHPHHLVAATGAAAAWLYLVEVEGWLGADDPRLERFGMSANLEPTAAARRLCDAAVGGKPRSAAAAATPSRRSADEAEDTAAL